MSKNTGVQYEKMIQHIYRQILALEGIKTIDVQHNIILNGKTTCHQIDVYWEFLLGGINYRTVIQAKDWANRVPQSAMPTFKAVLDDLPNGTTGIFITRSGFQQGAIDVAKANGICIYTFREPTEDDWEDRVSGVLLHYFIQTPIYEKLSITVDEVWARENNFSNSKIQVESSNLIIDEFGNELTVNDFIIELCYKCGEPPKEHSVKFEKTYIQPHGKKEKIMITDFKGIFGYRTHVEDVRIDAGEYIGYILQDVVTGNTKLFDKNNEFIKEVAPRV